MQGSNISSTSTSDIQTKLGGGLVVDNKYGPKTTAAVQAFQTANGLKSDGIFGPITEAAFNKQYNTAAPASNLIVTAGSAQAKFSQNSSDLSAALAKFGTTQTSNNNTNKPPKIEKDPILNDDVSGTTSDPYIQQLDTMASRSNDSTNALIQNIKAIKTRQANAIDAQYNNYKSGLQLLGIQTNAAQVTPDLLMSHINEAETEHQQKLSDLDNEEVKALADAETAKENNDFKTLATKMDYVKGIQKEKTDALRSYQEALTTQAKGIQEQGDATAKVIAPDIYTTLQTLDPADQESFLVSISKKFNIPLTSLITALVPEKEAADKAAAKKEDADNELLSPTEAATLGVPYGTTKAEATKKGITPSRYKPDSGNISDTKAEKNEIAQGKNVLKTGKLPDGTVVGNGQGSDGYYDPGVYNKLFELWTGTPKDFIAKYPIVGSINPLSYKKLPDALQKLLPKSETDNEDLSNIFGN